MTRILITVFIFSILSSCRPDKEQETICKDVDIDTLISIVAAQKIVQDEIRIVDSLSNHTRKLSFQTRPYDSLEVTYLVEVFEDNGHSLVTHFNFLVDIQTLKIINLNGKLEGQ